MKDRKPYKAFSTKPQQAGGVCPKVYLVFLSANVSLQGKQPDDYLIAMKLTSAAAEKVRDANPGSYIVKGYATKN